MPIVIRWRAIGKHLATKNMKRAKGRCLYIEKIETVRSRYAYYHESGFIKDGRRYDKAPGSSTLEPAAKDIYDEAKQITTYFGARIVDRLTGEVIARYRDYHCFITISRTTNFRRSMPVPTNVTKQNSFRSKQFTDACV